MALQDYTGLIPAPNNTQPLFTAWLSSCLQPEVDAMALLASIAGAFAIDSASGVQLDRIGEILKVSRIVDFQPGGGFSPTLSDDNYRMVLKAKIIKNQWKGTKQEIYDFWRAFFPTTPVIIQDNQDMTMTVLVVGMSNDLTGTITFGYGIDTATVKGYGQGWFEGFQSLVRQLVQKGYFVPKPAGVKVNYIFMENPAFAYGTNTDLAKGYGQGYWASF